MRKVVFVLALLTGAALAAMLYQQLFVERSLGPAALVAACALGLLFVSLLATLLLMLTRFHDTVGKLWLGAFSTLIAYLAIDVIAGWLLIEPLSPPLVPDQYRHHKLVPNSRAEFRQQDFAYVQRVNNLGLRGADVSVEEPAGTYRILMLGDSFTMGKGVKDDETSSVLLERWLRQRLAACHGRRIEVLNAGVDSYAPVLSLIQLKRDLTQLRPDLVILNLDVSDLAQESAYRREAVFGEDGEVVAVPQRTSGKSGYDKLRDWTGRNLFFTRLLLFYANRAMGHRELTVRGVVMEADPEIVAHTLEGDTVDRTRQWKDIFDSISRMKRYSDENGMGFVLTVYPWAHQISETEWVPGRYTFMPEDARPSERSRNAIRNLAAANGVELIDLIPFFQAYSGAEALYFKTDMHFTAAGQRVMAGGLQDYLGRRVLDQLCAQP
jgi:lysophospholipase L1-like esterase